MGYAPWVKNPHPAPVVTQTKSAQVAAQRAIEKTEALMAAATVKGAWEPTWKKAALVEVAETRGLETSGLTKAEIIDLLRSE